MSKRKQPTVAICYDFDGTLSPGNMQEHSYFPGLRVTPEQFWAASKERAREQEADDILAYMCLMLEKAANHPDVKVTRDAFRQFGSMVSLFEGVEGWFDRITQYGRDNGLNIEHYIISSGLKEMIEGTRIAQYFKRIYASAFMYNKYGVAVWPAHAINYTTKTQFLFRINKGLLDPWDNSKINDFIAKEDRPVPFTRMIYIGDGSTDIPCMKLVKDQGGYSIAAYQPHHRKRKEAARKLLNEDRVNFVAPADYRDGKLLDQQVKVIITKMAADEAVLKLPGSRKPDEHVKALRNVALATVAPDGIAESNLISETIEQVSAKASASPL